MTLQAVVFDFDGLIIDSEWLIFETARAAFAAHGHELTMEAWAGKIGTNDSADDRWWDVLCAACGVEGFAKADFDAAYRAQPREGRDELPVLPGVVELIDALHDAGIPAGVASSSSRGWLHRHLDRLGLLDRFGAVVGADAVGGVGKPAPDVYLKACAELGADPVASVAIEDSAHGVSAAKAAGMVAVAVPSELTCVNDFSQADLVAGSVADLDVDRLRALVRAPGVHDGA